jgi:hypothetical protein
MEDIPSASGYYLGLASTISLTWIGNSEPLVLSKPQSSPWVSHWALCQPGVRFSYSHLTNEEAQRGACLPQGWVLSGPSVGDASALRTAEPDDRTMRLGKGTRYGE